MKRVNIKQDRKQLNEGRDFGLGFSILKYIKTKDHYNTLFPFSACRDYLNDFAYVENTKIEIGRVYGFNYKLKNVLEGKEKFNLGVTTLHYNSGTLEWKDFAEASKILIENYKTLESLLNKIEDIIEIPHSTIEMDEDVLIFHTPIYWAKNSALLSVYSLIIRCFFNVGEKDLKSKDIKDLFESHSAFIKGDSFMISNCIKFLNCILIDKDYGATCNYEELNIAGKHSVHNFGIQSYLNRVAVKKPELVAV